MIEEDVGIFGDDVRLRDPPGVDIIKEVPVTIRGVPAVGRVVAALQVRPVMVANSVQFIRGLVFSLPVHAEPLGVFPRREGAEDLQTIGDVLVT